MKILVPFDFSEESMNSLNIAREMSTKFNFDILVVHCLGLPDFGYGTDGAANELKKELMVQARSQVLKTLNGSFGDTKGIDVIISEEDPSSKILKFNHRQDVAYTILGRKDIKVPDKVGSTTRDVLRYSKGAVLCIKEELELGSIKDILIATDFSTTPLKALHSIKAINDARLHFLYVNTKEKWLSTIETEQRMKAFAEIHGLDDYRLDIINDETLEQGILNKIDKGKFDLIALKIKSAEGKLDLLETHLSAERLMDHTDTPLMTYAHRGYYG